MKINRFVSLWTAAFTALILVGCEKDSPVSPQDEMATEDAAESIASAVGADDGGAMDQLSDIIELASVSGIR
jgi:hypothetical protein